MAWRTKSTEPAAERLGVFSRIGAVVVRWPMACDRSRLALAASFPRCSPRSPRWCNANRCPFCPPTPRSRMTTDAMSKAFQENSSANIPLVVLTNEKGLTKADEGTYKKIVDTCATIPRT